MMETITVLLIFFILLGIGIAFYGIVIKGKEGTKVHTVILFQVELKTQELRLHQQVSQ